MEKQLIDMAVLVALASAVGVVLYYGRRYPKTALLVALTVVLNWSAWERGTLTPVNPFDISTWEFSGR